MGTQALKDEATAAKIQKEKSAVNKTCEKTNAAMMRQRTLENSRMRTTSATNISQRNR
jgi:hypothetical protein